MADETLDPKDFLDPEDPLLEAAVDMAMAHHAGRLTPEAFEECRRMLTFLLATHPTASSLLRQAREHAGTSRGGLVEKARKKRGEGGG